MALDTLMLQMCTNDIANRNRYLGDSDISYLDISIKIVIDVKSVIVGDLTLSFNCSLYL